jgi:hypothetical protein
MFMRTSNDDSVHSIFTPMLGYRYTTCYMLIRLDVYKKQLRRRTDNAIGCLSGVATVPSLTPISDNQANFVRQTAVRFAMFHICDTCYKRMKPLFVILFSSFFTAITTERSLCTANISKHIG